MTQPSEENTLAAIDLGSNSFHMIIARMRDGHFQVVDRIREMVQLRAGLDEDGYISIEASQRALACLERFGERIKHLPAGNVRVVGTNTLRVAKNSQLFLRKARRSLNHPIEIIAGEEEARLIYLGVAHSLAFDGARRLVMDIGGGSTEFIIGEGMKGLRRESLEMGCVSFTQQFFSKGRISPTRMKTALLSAELQLRSIQRPYQAMGWVDAIGASGTVRCVANIVKENDWADDGVITPESLDKLIEAIVSFDHIDDIEIKGLSDARKTVITGGVAVLRAAFERLKIDKMIVSDGALREGLLYDLLGRIQHDDERDRTVAALGRRYQVDEAHADRVMQLATRFFKQVADSWDINHEDYMDRLQWAAKIHEVGLAIGYHSFHKHSAYLVAHSDLPGFSREEQHALAVLVQGQRRSFPKKDLKKLPDELQPSTKKLIVLLRLAMVFNRGRSERTDTDIKLDVDGKKLHLTLPDSWLENHPLTEADLLQEADYLKAIRHKLTVKG